MIEATDNMAHSIFAIHTLWKAKPKPTLFPKLPLSLDTEQLRTWLNDWLFKTGYIKNEEYRAMLAIVNVPYDFDEMGTLNEIFSAENGAKGE